MAGTARGLIVIPAFAGITTYGRQPAAPNNDPIAIVAAIANAPQKLTRSTARAIGALPAQAPSAPSSARKTSEAADKIGSAASRERVGPYGQSTGGAVCIKKKKRHRNKRYPDKEKSYIAT